ncbi:hypothetical protein TIFTF001_031701 [Ficus carica]|uniref:Uncharacterized protein n=1 Tax=Ficus carica TaxID=3494 RepID=A0AA88DV76_FICCA|nr:hypothetical protein TIFTF001_031701 [Ficus carica]
MHDCATSFASGGPERGAHDGKDVDEEDEELDETPNVCIQGNKIVLWKQHLHTLCLPFHPLFHYFFATVGLHPMQLNTNGIWILTAICVKNFNEQGKRFENKWFAYLEGKINDWNWHTDLFIPKGSWANPHIDRRFEMPKIFGDLVVEMTNLGVSKERTVQLRDDFVTSGKSAAQTMTDLLTS